MNTFFALAFLAVIATGNALTCHSGECASGAAVRQELLLKYFSWVNLIFSCQCATTTTCTGDACYAVTMGSAAGTAAQSGAAVLDATKVSTSVTS